MLGLSQLDGAVGPLTGMSLWTPKKFGSSVVAWYHADDIAAASGASFQTWPNRMGGPDAYQNSAGARMTVGALSTGAKAAAVANGSQWMRIDSTLVTAACAIFIVFQYVGAVPTSKRMIFSVGGGALTGGLHAMVSPSAGSERSMGVGVNSGFALTNPATGSFVLTTDPEQWVLTSSVAGSAAWINGGAVTLTAPQAATAMSAGTTPSAICAQPYTGSPYFLPTCKVREIVVLNRAATSGDAAAWKKYVTRTSGV